MRLKCTIAMHQRKTVHGRRQQYLAGPLFSWRYRWRTGVLSLIRREIHRHSRGAKIPHLIPFATTAASTAAAGANISRARRWEEMVTYHATPSFNILHLPRLILIVGICQYPHALPVCSLRASRCPRPSTSSSYRHVIPAETEPGCCRTQDGAGEDVKAVMPEIRVTGA